MVDEGRASIGLEPKRRGRRDHGGSGHSRGPTRQDDTGHVLRGMAFGDERSIAFQRFGTPGGSLSCGSCGGSMDLGVELGESGSMGSRLGGTAWRSTVESRMARDGDLEKDGAMEAIAEGEASKARGSGDDVLTA